MKQSNTRHNVFSKVDHDKAFIDVNYRDRKNESTKELPALRMDIRKKLASTHLSSKLSGKTPVITVATNLGEDENEDKYFNQFGNKDMVYDDDNASLDSNLSHDLENQKKNPDQLKMNDFMDELGKVGIGSDAGNDEEESYDSDDSYGEFVIRDRKKYTSTLDVHRKFMLKARKMNTISDIKTVASMKIMTHKKKAMKTAQDQDLLLRTTGTKGNNDIEQNSTPSKNTTNAIATSSSGGSLFGIGSATKSFMFLSKISATGTSKQPNTNAENSPQTSVTNSPALHKHKSVSIAPLPEVRSIPSSSPRDSPIPTPISSPSMYTASPGGYAYSSKHNLLQDSSRSGSASNSPLPLFGKAQKPKQIAHRAFSARTLSTLHSKFDTTHSVLSSTRNIGHVIKVATPLGDQLEVDNHMEEKAKPLYHVPTLKSVHGKKTMLGYLDKLFNAVTYQPSEPMPRPVTPPPTEALTVETLFKDQLLHADNKGRQISERELNTLLNSVQGPANYGPRIVPDRTTPAAIVAELEKQLEQQRREEQEEKRKYESIAAAHVAIVDDTTGATDDRTPTEGYSMATFASRLEELNTSTELAANQAGKFNPNQGTSRPLKLDLSGIHNKSSPMKPTSKAGTASKTDDPYSIDVHALKLPDITSPNSDAYSQRQKQPILCIYSPAPLAPTISTTGSPGSVYSSPDAGKSGSPSSAAVQYHSPIQLQGTLTSTASGHAASSPAIMYISSPDMMMPSSSTGPSAMMSLDSHGRSTASLPMIISKTHNDSHGDSHQQRHQYQTHAEYLKSLHPQTRDYVNSLRHTKDPDYHTDPRNYRGDSVPTEESVNGVDESIYDYDQEYEDMQLEPVGDRGAVDLYTECNRINLPSSAAQQGGDALLSMGYQYQHSTGTYIHKEEQNRSKFGQYQRAPLGDPYAGDFSDRHLEAITNTTVGTAPPVIFIPPGTPSSEPRLSQQPKTALSSGNNSIEGSVASRQFTHDPLHVNRIGKTSLEAGEVMQGNSYAPVRTVMQHPHGVALSSIHYRSEGIANTHTDNDQGSDYDEYDSFKQQYPVPASVISADNSTLQNSRSDGDIKQEICAYIEKLAAQNRAEHTKKMFHNNNTNDNNDTNTVYSVNNSSYDHTSHQPTTGMATIIAAEKARVKLWDKLNNRYTGDREGEFNKKIDIKEYIYKGIKEDTQIMKSYMEDIDEGWVV